MQPINWRIIVALVVVAALGALGVTLIVSSFGERPAAVDPVALEDGEGGGELPVLFELPHFQFLDQRGEPFSLGDLRGKVWVADFIFTRCRGVCPVLTRHMAAVQTRLRVMPEWEQDRLGIVSFSVDPEHDTPEVLRDYAAEHGADPEHWTFLTDSRAAMWRLISEGFKLAVGEEPGNTEMPITHTSKFALVDGRGRVRGYYDALDAEARDALVRDARRLLADEAPAPLALPEPDGELEP